MHTWWTGNWEGTDPVIPPGIHQRQLQRRRNRRRVQEPCFPETHSSDEGTVLPSEDRPTSQPEHDQYNLLAARSSATILTPEQTSPGPRRKRRAREIGAEGKADRAAVENVDLAEQTVQYPASRLTGTRLSPDMHTSAHTIATDTVERLKHAGQKEEAIPKWVITESRAER